MSLVDAFLVSPLAARLGWVFLHFLWQGALIAGALWLVLTALGSPRAQARYLASCVALGLMLVAPVATFLLISTPEATVSLPALLAALEGTTITGTTGTDWRGLVPVLAAFWLLGTLVQQVRLLYLWWATERLRHAFHLPLAAFWRDAVAEMCTRLGIRVPVRVVESAAAEVPTVVGWLAPIILVPTSALLQLNTEQLRMVLAHELAHIRRHDYLVNLIQTAVESLLFFHPAVWWISHRLRVEREYCCDDIAVGLGGSALVYARALERLETLREGEPRLALASTGGALMQRIQRLVKPESAARKSLTLGFLPVAVLLVGALSSTAFGFAGGLAGSQDERELSDAELERRIGELKRQIEELEVRLQGMRGERRSVRFGPQPDDGHLEVHVEPRHEEFDVRVEPRVRKFDVRVGDGKDRTIEIEIPEIRIPEIHVPGMRPGQDGGRRFQVRVPELRFGPQGGRRFEVRIPDLPDFEGLHEKLDGHLKELDIQFGDGEGNVFFFGDDEDFDFGELHGKLRKDLHERLEDVDWDNLHEGFGKLHELRTDFDVEGLHEHLRESMKGLRLHELKDLDELHFELDGDEIRRQIQESLKDLRDGKGEKHGSTQGMKFLIEIDPEHPGGKAHGFRWSAKDGEEPDVWIWRSEDGEGQVHGHEDDCEDPDHGHEIGVDWKRYDGAKDA